MPENKELRDKAEVIFLLRLERLAAAYRPIIIEAMGSPPDPRNVPESLWRDLEARQRRTSYWVMLFVALGSYRTLMREWGEPLPDLGIYSPNAPPRTLQYPGVTGPIEIESLPSVVPSVQRGGQGRLDIPEVPRIVEARAKNWAARNAFQLASGMTTSTQRRLAEAARHTNAAEQIAREIDRSFGRYRSKRVAITETTRAITVGEEMAADRVESELGWVLERIWQTERDERVCPICGPLQGKPESYYGPRVGSTPAHYNCRCWITWKRIYAPLVKVA